MFRRAMKRAMQNAMRLGAQGIKIMSSGRLYQSQHIPC
jgi:small subunit ribosomal protein S3